MRVLWFTNTGSLYAKNEHNYNGGGWIESLEELMTKKTSIELAISFFHKKDNQKKLRGSVTYYPILKKRKNSLIHLLENWSCRITNKSYVYDFMNVIHDFRPELIIVFGTEEAFLLIQNLTKIPVIIHIQGIINPCNNAYYPPGISQNDFLISTRFLKKHILGNSLLFDQRRYINKAKRELLYFKSSKYIMGRTSWDKMVVELLAPQATYIHVDEVLRPLFYQSDKWNGGRQNKTIIISILSDTIYKGIDLILKTAKLLKDHTVLPFEWHIAGLNKTNKLLPFFEHRLGIKCTDYNILNIGRLSCAELIESLHAANVFVHPSYIDNSSNSICEAQLLGLPVIACNSGGVSTLIENQVTGILVPTNAPYEMAHQIRELATNTERARQLGQHARKTALERHDREKILTDIISAYTNISRKSIMQSI